MPDALTILIIDDNEDDRFLYRRSLKSSDTGTYRLIESDNGEDGVSHITKEVPDCVLLDYSLPGRNGIEVLKRIRSKYPFVPILMLTGQGNETVAVAAMQEGAQHYITKTTITAETLQRSIRVAIEHCNLQHRIHMQRSSLELFTRALAHDLKEPVRTIRSFLDLLARPELPQDKAQQYFTYIQQAAERMSGLIETVYFYMRLDNENNGIKKEPCDSNQAYNGALENLAALIKERHAIVMADDLPPVMGNPIQLMQLLQNLISNAIHHCEESPSIHISVTRKDQQWLFRVSDNGPGIPHEFSEKIFEPFKRFTHHRSNGLGLGLAICKKIVESLGGKIWHEPVSPHGSAFCFVLEAANTAENTVEATKAAQPEDTSEPQVQDKLANIMIVEDNEADVELIRFALLEEQKLRCNFTVAHNGTQALTRMTQKAALHENIDLVLLDINMPGMDGFEFLTHMREQKAFQGVPVVMCSTSNYDKDIDSAKQLGANGYIVKPFDFAKLKPMLGSFQHLQYRKDTTGSTLLRA